MLEEQISICKEKGPRVAIGVQILPFGQNIFRQISLPEKSYRSSFISKNNL